MRHKKMKAFLCYSEHAGVYDMLYARERRDAEAEFAKKHSVLDPSAQWLRRFDEWYPHPEPLINILGLRVKMKCGACRHVIDGIRIGCRKCGSQLPVAGKYQVFCNIDCAINQQVIHDLQVKIVAREMTRLNGIYRIKVDAVYVNTTMNTSACKRKCADSLTRSVLHFVLPGTSIAGFYCCGCHRMSGVNHRQLREMRHVVRPSGVDDYG